MNIMNMMIKKGHNNKKLRKHNETNKNIRT